MAWTTPKTNWYGVVIDGVYTGDKFNAADFNRIKNNLDYLRDLAVEMYESFTIGSVGADKTAADYFYADEINQLERNLNIINAHTVNRSYGSAPTYYDNGKLFNYQELNRLESAILDLYDNLTNQHNGRRSLIWNFGMKGGI